ncbi:MAG: ABC transporter ATP-binding protein [Solirubrobacterales bacterium]|nr:ABC transporter ATP-binding protein [Solirubrobacterales bacterium]
MTETATSEPVGAQSERCTAAVRISGASVRLGGRIIFADVDLTVDSGQFVAILGPNGAGKSTLMRAILGLAPLAAGSVQVLGDTPAGARSRVGYLPQQRSLDRAAGVRGVDLVRLGLDGTRWGLPLPPLGKARRRSERNRIAEVIELVGASAYAGRAIGELSGGEQQRLLIAQALVRRPELLILDEPLDSLDLPNQAAVAALVRGVTSRERVAVLLVAHDVNPLLPHLDRVVYLAGGRALTGPVDEVITAPRLSALYGAPIEVLRTSDGRLVVVGLPEAPHHHGDRHEPQP